MSENVDGIVLAAGYSSRAHKFKMGLPVGDKLLLERTIASMASVCQRIIVVTGHNRERVETIVKPIPQVITVFNEKFKKGMFTSVKRGIKEVEGNRFFLIPGDQPLVKPETYQAMLQVDAKIVSPRCQGKKGHPVLFNSELIPELLALPDDGILRDFIHEIGAVCLDVADYGIHLDVDTEEDYRKLMQYFKEEYND
jgi:molybdenum cofactor cytidylyltransferase